MRVGIILCAALLVLAVATAAVAQAGGARAGDRSARGDGQVITKELGLSQDQVKRIGDIAKKFRTDAGAVMRSSAAQADKQKKIAALKASAAKAIDAVLTPAQRQKAKDKGLTKGLLDRFLGHGMRDHTRFLKFLDELGLSAAQKTKVKAITNDWQAKAKTIADSKSLSPDQRRARMMALRNEAMDKIKAVLTPQQRAKLEKMRKERGGPGQQPTTKKTKRAA